MWLLNDAEVLRRAKTAHLREELQQGLDDLDAGRSKPLDRALIERIKAEGRQEASPQQHQRKRPA